MILRDQMNLMDILWLDLNRKQMKLQLKLNKEDWEQRRWQPREKEAKLRNRRLKLTIKSYKIKKKLNKLWKQLR